MSVRIIGLDESGSFNYNSGEMNFIGGFAYDVEDIEQEKKNINQLFMGICEEFNRTVDDDIRKHVPNRGNNHKVVYPYSIHGSKMVFFKEGNLEKPVQRNQAGDRPKCFLKLLEERVVQYLSKQTNCKIYVFLDINEIVGERKNVSNLFDLKQEQNLYNTMALQAVFNQVYYVMEDIQNKYCLEIATRTLPGEGGDLYAEVPNEEKDKEPHIVSTVQETYRAGINVFLREKNCAKSSSEYKLHVRSAKYTSSNKDKNGIIRCYDTIDEKELTPFQYMADIVCDYIRFLFKRYKDSDNNNAQYISIAKLKELNLSSNIKGIRHIRQIRNDLNLPVIEIRAFSKCDELLCAMIECIDNRDLVNYFDLVYDLENLDESVYICKEFYKNVWKAKAEKYLNSKFEDESNKKAWVSNILVDVSRIEKYLRGKDEYEKGLYISLEYIALISRFAQIFSSTDDMNNRNKALFRLHDCAMSGYSHRGSVIEVKEHMEACKRYERNISVEEKMVFINRCMSYYFNSLEIEKIFEKIQEVRQWTEQVENIYNNIFGNDDVISTLNGKYFSSIGQAYAFLGEYDKSKENFEKALRCLEADAENYMITYSFYLHMLLEQGNRDEYQRNAERYFGTQNGLESMLEKIFEQDQDRWMINNRFMLYVYIKAFNIFYSDDEFNRYILDSLLERLLKIENNRVVSFHLDNIHPWELIYKHLLDSMIKLNCCDINALLNGTADKNDKMVKYCIYVKDKVFNGIPNANWTIKLIQFNSRFQLFYKYVEDIRDKTIKQLYENSIIDGEDLNTCKEYFGEDIFEKTANEFKRILDKKVTYMYH